MADKKRKEPEPINPDDPDVVEVTPLGAGQEVGRSCIVLKYRYDIKVVVATTNA